MCVCVCVCACVRAYEQRTQSINMATPPHPPHYHLIDLACACFLSVHTERACLMWCSAHSAPLPSTLLLEGLIYLRLAVIMCTSTAAAVTSTAVFKVVMRVSSLYYEHTHIRWMGSDPDRKQQTLIVLAAIYRLAQ